MSKSIRDLETAVRELGALPMPVGETSLTAEQHATIAEQLADAKPATAGLVADLARAVRDVREHEHPKWEDLYCLNLVSYMGERMGPVLRRMLDAEDRIERRRLRLVKAEADLLEMRGLLSPNGEPRRIPAEVEIHERVAPAVEWLLNRVADLETASQQGSDRWRARCDHIAKQGLRWKAEAEGRKEYGEKLRARIAELEARDTPTWRERAEKAEACVAELEARLAEYEPLNPQQCPVGKHADWLVDSEYAHKCPWCRIAELEAPAAAHQRKGYQAAIEVMRQEKLPMSVGLLEAQQELDKLDGLTPGLTVYRASHDSIVMGLYTTAAAARAHCETVLRREIGDTGDLGWIPDDGSDGSPEELSIFGPGVDEDGVPYDTATGYLVTPLEVAAAYDPDGDE